jgi:SAM-dependent methyltransferase
LQEIFVSLVQIDLPMPRPVVEISYPESRFGGFGRYDGTVHFYSRVNALLGRKSVILDVGCGRGAHHEDDCEYRRSLRNLRDADRTVIGIDRDRAGEENPSVDCFRSIEDIDHWPVDDESVDLVLADYVLEHVGNPEQFFRETWRVLKPGGCFCARTPNAFGYVVFFSRLVPNRFHAKVLRVAQEGREEKDVFPTVYRCNTTSKLRRLLDQHGFIHAIYRTESEPAYMSFSRIAYRVFVVIHRILPSVLQSTLLVFARKKDSCGENSEKNDNSAEHCR